MSWPSVMLLRPGKKASSYKQLIKEDEEISKLLTEEDIENIFDYKVFLKEIDYIFEKQDFKGRRIVSSNNKGLRK